MHTNGRAFMLAQAVGLALVLSLTLFGFQNCSSSLPDNVSSSSTSVAQIPALSVSPTFAGLLVGQTAGYIISGGQPPYTSSIGNSTVASETGGVISGLAVGSTALTITDAKGAQVKIDVSVATACVSGKQVLTASGSFLVPFGCTHLTIKAWGAAGGGSGVFLGQPGMGGAGGFAQTSLTVQAGQTLSVFVGQGGGSNGDPGNPSAFSGGGGGGGYSGVFTTATPSQAGALLIAGGGGGAGAGHNGGAGGGTAGQSGTGPEAGGSGTQSAGGAAVAAPGPAGPGSALMGGAGYDRTGTFIAGGQPGGGAASSEACGGGGGGYFGGAGGGYTGGVNTGSWSSGGGGSGYVTSAGTGSVLSAGSGQNAANTADADYASGTGTGSYLKGGNGLVVISYF